MLTYKELPRFRRHSSALLT